MLENYLQCTDQHNVETFGKNKPKILLLGHGGHGKTTVANLLNELYNYRCASSSEIAFHYIYPALAEANGYKTMDEAKRDKANNRMLWKELISLLNTSDKTTLAQLIINNNDVYDGMRAIDEYRVSKKLFDVIIWVDASRRVGDDLSMEIKFDKNEMLYLNNNCSENVLVDRLKLLHKSVIGV